MLENPNLSIIIPVFSGIITLIASLWLTTLRSKSDLRKIKTIHKQSYAKSLFDKRVETYPELYSILSNYGKIIHYKKQSKDNLCKFNDQINDWNNENGIFLSGKTISVSHRFRKFINLVLSDNKSSHISEAHWQLIDRTLKNFEASIRNEIGVSDQTRYSEYIKDGNLSLDHEINELNKEIDTRE